MSAGLVLGIARQRAEEFSFALAVVLTPAVIVKEAWRLYKSESIANTLGGANLLQLIGPSLLGMGVSFLAGLLALRWLANWLHHGRWPFFGIYCLFAACVVLWVG